MCTLRSRGARPIDGGGEDNEDKGQGMTLRRWLRSVAAMLAATVTIVLCAAAAAQAGTLSGTVSYGRDVNVIPTAGVTVTAVDVTTGRAAGSVMTDPLGGYALLLAGGDYDVTFSQPGERTQTFSNLSLGRDRTLDVTLVHEGWARFAGTLLDADGAPVSGADVTLGWPTRATDGAGRFDIYLPLGDYDVALAGAAWSFERPGYSLDEDVELELTLPPHVTTTGRLRTADGDPLAGAPVAIDRGLGQYDPSGGRGLLGGFANEAVAGVVTDRAGEFQLAGYPVAGGLVTAIPGDPRWGPTSGSRHSLVTGEPLVLTAPRMSFVSGTLSDPSGPVEGVLIEARGGGSAVTAADGSFSFWALDGGATTWIRQHADGSGWEGQAWLDLSGDPTLRLTLPATEQRVVRVYDGDGDAVAGALVERPNLSGSFETAPGLTIWFGYFDRAQATTDRSGQVVFPVLAPVRTSGGPGTITPPAGSELPNGQFTLDTLNTIVSLRGRPGKLTGSLSFEDETVSGGTATLEDGQSTTLDADGRFVFFAPEGTYALTLEWTSADGGAWSFMRRTAVGYPNAFFSLIATRQTRLVSVVDQNGAPIGGAQVRLPGYAAMTYSGTLRVEPPPTLSGAFGIASFRLPVTGWPDSGGATVTAPGYLPANVAVPRVAQWTSPVTVVLAPADQPPTVTLDVTPEPLVRGDWWSVARVAVQVTAEDPQIAALACAVDGVTRTFAQTRTATAFSGTFYVNTEGRHVASCTALDGGGRTGSAQRNVGIDLKNPAAPTLSTDRPAEDALSGWFRDSVTVSFADNGDPLLADSSAGSGVDPASVPAPVTYATSGAHRASGTVADRSGRSSAARSLTVKVDADAPSSTLTCPAGPVALGATAYARWADADGQSGLSGNAAGNLALDTSAVGSFTAEHTARDRVGHTTVSSCVYDVAYPFVWRGGIAAPPSLNAVAPGVRTLRVWFSIGGDHGLGILSRQSPLVAPIDCSSGRSSGPQTAASLAGPLVWDAATGRYALDWQVGVDLPAGGCAALRLVLDDGLTREALFAR